MKSALGLLILVSPFALGLVILILRRRQRCIAVPVAPPSGPALASAATKAAFQLYALRSLAMVPGGALWAAALFWLSPWISSAGLVVSFWGVFCVGNVVRVGWRLRDSPWRPHACRLQHVPGIMGGFSPVLVLDPERSGADATLELTGFSWRSHRFARCDGATVWVAGDPDRGCVVAMPGGTHFIWARRQFRRRNRERLRRIILKPSVAEPSKPRIARTARALRKDGSG